MKLIEDYSEIEVLLLPKDDDEDADISSDPYEEINRLTGEDYEVAYDGEEVILLVAQVPNRAGCYALLELDWEMGMWSCEGAVECALSRQTAGAAMLERYAIERLPNPRMGTYNRSADYKEFLWGLIPKPETIKPSGLVSRLIKEAQDLIDNHETSGGDHFPCETELSEDEDVVWVSQGFDGNYLVYVYRVRCALQSTQFIALLHSDGGVVGGCSGPWATLEDVHASFTAEEGGWINMEHYGSYPSGTSG